MKQKKQAWIYLFAAILSFSSFEVVSKTVSGYIDPTQLTFIRFLTGSLCLLPLCLKELKKRSVRLGVTDLIKMFFLGALNVAISMNLLQIGFQYTNANLSAIIISANPLFVTLFSSFVLKEKLNLKKLLGLLLGVCGVIIAVGGTGTLQGEGVFWGILLQVAGMLCFSLYTVIGKKTSLKFGSCVMTTLTGLFGSLALLPILIIGNVVPWEFDLAAIPIQMIYICVVNTGLAFFLYFRALECLDTGIGSMSFFMKPLLASILAALFLGESVSWPLFLGIIFVAGGIYLAVLSSTAIRTKNGIFTRQREESNSE